MGMAERSGPDITARLLLALTGLYAERLVHTSEERQQYVELALRLIDKVDEATRATVAGILRNHAAAPAEVCERLAPMQLTPPDDASSADATAVPALVSDPADLAEAFFTADATERRRLLLLFAGGAGAGAGSAAASGALDEAREDAGAATFIAPEPAAQRYGGLDAAAMEGRIGEFIREFERVLGVPKSLCERISTTAPASRW